MFIVKFGRFTLMSVEPLAWYSPILAATKRPMSYCASSEANVDAQILATVDEVGYVLTDISAGLGREALEELSHLPETVRLIATPL